MTALIVSSGVTPTHCRWRCVRSLAPRVRWLRDVVVPRLDHALGFQCPPIVIDPALWRHDGPDGRVFIGEGFVTTCPAGNIWRLSILLPGALLAPGFYDDDHIAAIVVHELLHVIYLSIEYSKPPEYRGDVLPCRGDEPNYLARDAAQLADCDLWMRGAARLAAGLQGVDSRPVR